MLTNDARKHIAKLQQKKIRRASGEFIVDGVKSIQELLKSELYTPILIIVDGKRRDESAIATTVMHAEGVGVPVEYAGRKDINAIKTTTTFPGIQAIVEMPDVGLDMFDTGEPIVCLDDVSDPGNLGTIIRTADWFGVRNILLSENCVDPYNPKVVRSSMGSLFRVQLFESQALEKSVATLRDFGYTTSVLAMDGESLEAAPLKKKSIYIFGSESHGVRETLHDSADHVYRIGGGEKTESLNVAIAAGITLHQLYRSRN